ncbi:MAG TPA: hypothetical protein VIE46_12630 [Gemmatimonadales bacterium]
MAAAALTGTLVVVLAVLGVDLLRFGWVAGSAAGRTATGAPSAAAATLLLGGTFGGFVMAGVAGWWLLAPLDSLYRRAALALASSFATVVLMLTALPVHQWAGQPGLLGFALLLATGAFVFALRARRAARDQ